MITVKFYLDSRMVKDGHPSSLKIAIIYKLKSAFLPLKIKLFPKNWNNKTCKVIGLPNKDEINLYITNKKTEVDNLVFSYINNKVCFENVYQVRDRIVADLNGVGTKTDDSLFVTRFKRFADTKQADKTKAMYLFTLKRISDYDSEISTKHFEDITKSWLNGFDYYLSQTSKSKNGRNVHLRNIRAVFNDAIDDNITTFYPFRTFKIRPVQTRKRSLTVIELRMLMNYPVEDYQKRYVDLFMLDFYLIGINMIDLLKAKTIINGRLEYTRAKTKKLYSIKVEPEAQTIIDAYKGENYLLNILDDSKNYQDFLNRMNKNLKRIGFVESEPITHKKTINPLFPDLSTYWCRHSWATIAAELDIPKEVIAHALGHGNNTVTDIYINFDIGKVDLANRRVIDYVLER